MSERIRIVIVGGVAGGMSAATRARRTNENASIIVFEKTGHISFANCGLPYYLDKRIPSREKLLLTTPAAVLSRYRIDARVGHEVIAIDRAEKRVKVRELASGREFDQAYDKLILATGANPVVPAMEHVRASNVVLVRNVEDILHAEEQIALAKVKRVVVVGAGYIGLEMADALKHAGMEMTILEKAAHPMPLMDSELVQPIIAELKANGVNVVLGDGIASLKAEAAGRVTQVISESGKSIDTDLVVLSIGVRPNVKLAQEAGLEIGASGAVKVDQYQRTSDADVYAVGDMAEVIHEVTGKPVRIPLAGPANRAGRNAGEHAATGRSAAAGRVLGTSIVQVFGMAAGLTGLSLAQARAAGFDADCAYVLPSHHAGYYPDAQQMRIKLVYDKTDGRVLGAQAVGNAGVDKRLDVIATTIHFRGTIDDLSQLDLAYSPQYGSAKDAVHYAAFVAQNQRSGLTPGIDPRYEFKDLFLLDVRTAAEYAKGALPGSINIPVDELRERINEIPTGRKIAVTCQVGLRGHVATRLLRERGFDAVNVKGGYATASLMPRG